MGFRFYFISATSKPVLYKHCQTGKATYYFLGRAFNSKCPRETKIHSKTEQRKYIWFGMGNPVPGQCVGDNESWHNQGALSSWHEQDQGHGWS